MELLLCGIVRQFYSRRKTKYKKGKKTMNLQLEQHDAATFALTTLLQSLFENILKTIPFVLYWGKINYRKNISLCLSSQYNMMLQLLHK
jgi:hypothetical protein